MTNKSDLELRNAEVARESAIAELLQAFSTYEAAVFRGEPPEQHLRKVMDCVARLEAANNYCLSLRAVP
jgi:hypothetical protein